MGRFNRRIKRNRTSENAAAPKDHRDYEENTLIRENAAFEAYYRAQGVIPEGEFEEFMGALRTGLPSTFRITGNRQTAMAVQRHLEEVLVPSLPRETAEGLALPVPEKIDWYPEGLGWNMLNDRKAIRSQASYAAFHEWLKAATENGDISRQEAVSMIPPLLLDVQPDHLVLDMCAAPGSKTSQIVEQLHAKCPEGQVPSGLVIANDLDQKRAYLLHHQVKRILSPSLCVTNNDAAMFPRLTIDGQAVAFDRILADVPCSGDGTMRKNPGIWREWSAGQGLGLHPLQVRILDRAVHLAKVGGRIVYSTCSLNPIEDEAVVAWILSKYQGKLKLVDCSGELPGLKRMVGVSAWKVTSRDGKQVYESMEAIPEKDRRRYYQSMFPQPECSALGLDKCMRIAPHHQNTGGFFIAVLEKTEEVANVATTVATASAGEPVAKEDHNEEPVAKEDRSKDEGEYVTLAYDHHNLRNIFDQYGIDVDRLKALGLGFITRSDRDPLKTVATVSASAYKLMLDLAARSSTLRIVNIGARAFEIYDINAKREFACPYRILSESTALFEAAVIVQKRRVMVSPVDLVCLLESDDSVPIEKAISQAAAAEEVRGWPEGGMVLVAPSVAADGHPVVVPVWKGEKSLKAFIPKANRPALLYQLRP